MQATRSRLPWLCLVAMLLCSVVASAAVRLKPNDRVVIFGDSITEQRLYSRYMSQYFSVRYPELNLKFYNAGWGGDTAGGGFDRLQRDVLSLNPTVVTLFFGMNDGAYHDFDATTTATYRANLEKIIAALVKQNVRVVVFGPSCVDYDKLGGWASRKYNEQLAAESAAALELAAKYNLPSADVVHPMMAFQDTHKAADKNWFMVPDGIHPSPAGHQFMLHEMLKAFDADPAPAIGSVDVTSGVGDGLKVTAKDASQIELTTTGKQMVPYWSEPDSAAVMRDCGMWDFSGQKLTVKGLAAGKYAVDVDGNSVGSFSADELAAGATIAGSYSEAGHRVHDLCQKREDLYFQSWRSNRIPLANYPGVDKLVKNLLAADDSLQSMIQKAARAGKPATITLTQVPSGANLALKKPYECSDPNGYHWGIGGLTDGSWENNSQHCFASGDALVETKTATVDLGAEQRICTIVLGVPPFGSTKTIVLSVSADGTNYKEVGRRDFKSAREARWVCSFDPTNARYVRLTYPSRYQQVIGGYNQGHVFTTELEVYAP